MRQWILVVLMFSVGCGGAVSSDEEAAMAYVGLDGAVGRAMTLGLKGFSDASSANIPAQADVGDVSGTMDVSGQADQGSSDNKGLRLSVVLVDYADVIDVDDDGDEEVAVTYQTAEAAPADVDLQLKGMPDGTFSGSFVGDFLMDGDLEGVISLNLSLSGGLEPDPEVDGGVQRESGTLMITGTATNEGGGVYDVDVLL